MIFLYLLLLFTLSVYLFLQQPQFGRRPTGERRKRVRNSPFYQNGAFQNRSVTPNFSDGAGYGKVMYDFFIAPKPRRKPAAALPSVKTDLHALRPDENVLVWFGHSSYFMQIDGKRMLVDPVLSGAASPIPATTRSFAGSDVYTADDMPDIDYLFMTHDHWDHLDYATILQLKPRIGKVICSLGIGEHFERWGFDPARITEKDWMEEIPLDAEFSAHALPARHFSGRTFVRNQAIWTAFALMTPSRRIFIGGDSGYDTHFAEIGEQYGPFDLAILECGQYNPNWKYIHMMPEEVPQAARDLRARRLLPVHWAKFALSTHPWDDPMLRVSEASRKIGMPLVHPLIGEKVDLKSEEQVFSEWWTGLE